MDMNFPKLVVALLSTLPLCPVTAADRDSDSRQLYLIDAHSQADSEAVLGRILPLMDQAGVRHTILAARSRLTSGDIASFASLHPLRITASVRTKGRAYQENRNGYFKVLRQDVGSGKFGAIAELLMYHAQKGNKAPEVIVYPDDKRVQATLALARQKGWPLVAHIEFASLSGGRRTEFMRQLEAMLVNNPDHPFALIHMGQLGAGEVRRLIEAHPNVYFLTAHTNPAAIEKSNQPWIPMFKGDVLAPEWKALVTQHPDRFILAFDNVWADHWGDFYLREAGYWHTALADLPGEVAHAIAHGNAERLWKIPAK